MQIEKSSPTVLQIEDTEIPEREAFYKKMAMESKAPYCQPVEIHVHACFSDQPVILSYTATHLDCYKMDPLAAALDFERTKAFYSAGTHSSGQMDRSTIIDKLFDEIPKGKRWDANRIYQEKALAFLEENKKEIFLTPLAEGERMNDRVADKLYSFDCDIVKELAKTQKFTPRKIHDVIYKMSPYQIQFAYGGSHAANMEQLVRCVNAKISVSR